MKLGKKFRFGGLINQKSTPSLGGPQVSAIFDFKCYFLVFQQYIYKHYVIIKIVDIKIENHEICGTKDDIHF